MTADRWKPKRPLVPGAIYDWQVVAYDRRGKARASVPNRVGTLRFKVLEAEQATAPARLRQTAGRSHLVMGVHYAHEGLLEEAEQEFAALAQANPDSSVAQSLLRSGQAMRET